jgi:hypothetical protein
MRLVRLAILPLLLGPWAAAADFTALPPHPIVGFAGFQVFEGELVSPRLKAGYRFYVDPARAALFTVMRYRLRNSGPVESPTEKFVWNEKPGQRVPLRCFEWIEATSGGTWREMDLGSAAYVSEMRTLGLVLVEQNRAYHRQVEPEASQE